ncbi:metal-dependent hydrolase [Caminicella sporogenes]|uniref:metal-dependent hydrolase n=1 Tax=Caminicella sporogenes TaxID=166485 RepID=UPI0025404420|nr:metal-dependent hydrolase [Caminicella sporogenes]WIF95693.1 metal-dependent hydrolase [Caminicella sporogenes]
MKIKYLGHAAFYIEEGNFKALIDPFLSGNPTAKSSPENFSNINYIFITHGHGDHLGDTVQIAKNNNSIVITNFEISLYLGNQNVNTHPMHIGGKAKFDFGTVKMTPALHGSGIQTEKGLIYGGNPCGFVIELDGKKIYHAGDTGLTMDMKLLESENIDLAILPIGGNFTMDIDDAVKAVEFIKPKKVIPIHYNTFPIIKASPEEFKSKVKNSEVIILKPDEEYNL